jgi:glutathione S-transferase
MKLYHNRTSPFVRKVMIVLLESGQADAVTLIPSTGTPIDPASLPVTQNPLGKVPALERDDGPTLYDSRVICRYLDDRGNAGLYPQPPALWDSLTLEATADGMMEAAILMVYESRIRPEDKRLPDWVEAQWAKIDRSLDVLNARWLSHLKGRLDIGQIAVACALSYLDLRHEGRNWRRGRDGLADWHAGFAGRDSMVATRPEG